MRLAALNNVVGDRGAGVAGYELRVSGGFWEFELLILDYWLVGSGADRQSLFYVFLPKLSAER